MNLNNLSNNLPMSEQDGACNHLLNSIMPDISLKTQDDKNYMMYKNGKFYHEYVNLDDYRIISYEKDPEKNRYLAKSKSRKEIKILLRWKNGNGIAFPAFQISC